MAGEQAKRSFLLVTRVLVLIIYAVIVAYVVILTIAFVLQLLGASPTANFVDWIYRATAQIMQPFRGMFPNQQVSGASVFNASLMFAVIIYSLLALLLQGALNWLAERLDEIAYRRQARAAAAEAGPIGRPTTTGVPGQPSAPAPESPAGAPGRQGASATDPRYDRYG